MYDPNRRRNIPTASETSNNTETPVNNPENIAYAMNLISTDPTTGNLNLQNIIYGKMDSSLTASTAEIYYAILRSRNEGQIIMTREGGTRLGIDLSDSKRHAQRINVLKQILKAAAISPGCKLEVVSSLNKSNPAESEEKEKPPEFVNCNLDTVSVERGPIKWKVKIETGQAFVYPSHQGDRIFVVTEIENDQGDKWIQSFYKSTGKNSGNEGTWFPNQGTWGEGWDEHISKEEYSNQKAPKRISDGTKNPLTRMGNFGFILRNGSIFRDISNQLTNISMKPTEEVSYSNINNKLRQINPAVDIDSVYTREVAEKMGWL